MKIVAGVPEEKWRDAEMHFARMDAEQHLSWREDEDEFDRIYRSSSRIWFAGIFVFWVLVVRGWRLLKRFAAGRLRAFRSYQSHRRLQRAANER